MRVTRDNTNAGQLPVSRYGDVLLAFSTSLYQSAQNTSYIYEYEDGWRGFGSDSSPPDWRLVGRLLVHQQMWTCLYCRQRRCPHKYHTLRMCPPSTNAPMPQSSLAAKILVVTTDRKSPLRWNLMPDLLFQHPNSRP